MKLKIALNDNNSAKENFWDGGCKGRHVICNIALG